MSRAAVIGETLSVQLTAMPVKGGHPARVIPLSDAMFKCASNGTVLPGWDVAIQPETKPSEHLALRERRLHSHEISHALCSSTQRTPRRMVRTRCQATCTSLRASEQGEC